MDPQRATVLSRRFVLSGVATGLLTVGLVYLSAWLRVFGDPVSLLIDLHRQWPAFLVLDTTPIVLGLVGLLVARNRLAEEELERLTAHLGPWSDGHAVESVSDGVLLVDGEGVVIAANPAAPALLGWPTVVGMRLEKLVSQKGGPGLGPTDTFARDGTITQRDVVSAPASGQRVIVVVRAPGLAAPDEEVVAERNRLLAALKEAQEQARGRSAFVAGLSHELRTPLNAILGYSELVQEELRDQGVDMDEELGAIQGAARHLLTLVNNVLELSRLDAGRTLVAEIVPLAGALNDVKATMRPLASRNGNQLKVSIRDGVMAIRGDDLRFRQVLINLVGNACKFTKNGRIDVIARYEQADGRVAIDVTDTGIGMTPEQVGRLFQDYVQADPSIRKEYGGTGLGLSLSRRLVEAMGGTLTVTSEHGKGSTFTLRLPWGDARRTLIPDAVSLTSLDLRTDPLLVVDDRPAASRDRWARELAELGVVVEWLAEAPPDQVSGRAVRGIWVDGYPERLAALARSDALSGVPLLSSDEPDLQLPSVGWLQPPVSAPDVLAMLRRLDRTVSGALVVGTDGAAVDRLVDALTRREWYVARAHRPGHRFAVALVVGGDPPGDIEPRRVIRLGPSGDLPLVDDDDVLVDMIEVATTFGNEVAEPAPSI
ncbi:MAG: PAS domain-containing protein [Alphaproteobacteria bacterium]|nr:PAS domain-containing protein [Alphaproteobacteria bacterium]MCB9696714.1 PAS domain-containing protein [Alphaproteobacteria bacterium]